jgi:glycosyltransferase involved in cell wall biosynthesis
MRISLLVSSLRCGGAERIAAMLANSWAERGDAVQVLSLDPPDETPFYSLSPKVSYRALALRADSRNFLEGAYQLARRSFVIRKALRAWKPQIVITLMENVYAVLATRGLGIPVIISERGLPDRRVRDDFVWNHLVPRLYPKAEALVIPSQGMSEWYRTNLGVSATVIPNPVLAAPRVKDLSQFGKRVIAAGRLSPEKGYELLLEAFAEVLRDHPDASLTIYGEGSERSSLEAHRARLGLGERVSLPGLVDDLPSRFADYDLFICSSHHESFGNVLCEAMSAGVPVVSFNCPWGPAEIVRDGIDGILVPPGDTAALAETISRVLANAALRKQLSQNAREITARFSLPRVLAIWDTCIADCRAKLGLDALPANEPLRSAAPR